MECTGTSLWMVYCSGFICIYLFILYGSLIKSLYSLVNFLCPINCNRGDQDQTDLCHRRGPNRYSIVAGPSRQAKATIVRRPKMEWLRCPAAIPSCCSYLPCLHHESSWTPMSRCGSSSWISRSFLNLKCLHHSSTIFVTDWTNPFDIFKMVRLAISRLLAFGDIYCSRVLRLVLGHVWLVPGQAVCWVLPGTGEIDWI